MDRLTDKKLLEGWVPARLYWADGKPVVDWCYLGRRRFKEPFFSETIGNALAEPFNLLFRHQTPIEVLGQWHEASPGLKPTGLIFHSSRCGSTLITQSLAAVNGTIVVSEAAPLDSALRSGHGLVTEDQRILWFRWMVSALGQKSLGNEKHFFIKFDAWNISELPLISRAFPGVPWIFTYRDPVEILVSQLDHRGAHMVPGVINPKLFGMTLEELTTVEPEEYCARVLAAICRAGLQFHANGGLLINYRQLPEVTWGSISEFFGVSWTEAELEMMNTAARRNSKSPHAAFTEDSNKKQQRASERIRAAAHKWVLPVYEELEAARKLQFSKVLS
jgi:hypothetical protein